MFTSSTAVYAQSGGEWVDEDSETAPHRFNGRVLLEAEARIHAAPWPGCSLRLGGLYGPERTRLQQSVREGRVRLDPGPPRFTNRIHLDDAAAALEHLLTVKDLPSVLLGVDDEPADANDVLRFLAGEFGLPEPPFADSPGATRVGSKRCRNARLRAGGFELAFPTYREGYRSTIDSERASGP